MGRWSRSKAILCQHALVTDAFDFEELAIDLVAQIPQMGKIRHRLRDMKIIRVVDRRFRPERALLLEILLHV